MELDVVAEFAMETGYPKKGCSSVGRAAVSKTAGRGFETLRPCQVKRGQSRPTPAMTVMVPHDRIF